MRKYITAVLLLGACAESTAQKQERLPFEMCDPQRVMSGLSIDFRTGHAEFEDVRMNVLRCGQDDTCMKFPINLSSPPRLPSSPGETVRWVDDGHRFSLVRSANAERYNLRSESPPRFAAGRRFPPLVQFVVYDREAGVREIQLEDLDSRGGGAMPLESTPKWVACGGNLRFDDVPALMALAAPDGNDQ